MNKVVDVVCTAVRTGSFKSIDFGGNELPSSGVAKLLEACRTQGTLELLELGGNTFSTKEFELLREVTAENGKIDIARDIPERNQADNMVVSSTVGVKGGSDAGAGTGAGADAGASGGSPFGRAVEVNQMDVHAMMKAAGWKTGNFEK